MAQLAIIISFVQERERRYNRIRHCSIPIQFLKTPPKPLSKYIPMATTSIGATPFRYLHFASPPRKTPQLTVRACATLRRSVEEIYNVRVERNVPKKRLDELGVQHWSTWKTKKCQFPWDWQVDQQVYIVSGEVRVVPHGAKSGDRYMRFVAGDLVRYPKWLEADMFFNGPYEERYRFRAYGDD